MQCCCMQNNEETFHAGYIIIQTSWNSYLLLLVSQFPSISVSWFPYKLKCWFPGLLIIIAFQFLGFKMYIFSSWVSVFWFLGFLVFVIHFGFCVSFLVSWFLDFLDPLSSGFLDFLVSKLLSFIVPLFTGFIVSLLATISEFF